MPYQKEQLKFALISAIIGSLLSLLIHQIFTTLNFSGYLALADLSISLGVFLGVFLVLSIIGKLKKPSFFLILPVFLIYFAILFSIQLIQTVLFFYSVSLHPSFTLSALILEWLEYGVPYLAVFGLIGSASGIMMVRLTSKLKYDAFHFIFASLIGVGAGTILIKICWEVIYNAPYPPSFPYYLSIFTLIGALIGIAIIQIAWLRKRQPSNSHTFISVAFWIIAFIIIIFIYEWLTYVHPPWF